MNNISLSHIGSTLKKHRKIKNLSTEEFTEKLGVSVGLINNIENGRVDTFKFALLIKLMNELDLSTIPLSYDKIIHVLNKHSPINSESLMLPKNNLDTEELFLVKNELDRIITAFLELVFEYGYNVNVIELLTEHFISEINFLKNIKSLR